jgi:hypothetical protein
MDEVQTRCCEETEAVMLADSGGGGDLAVVGRRQVGVLQRNRNISPEKHCFCSARSNPERRAVRAGWGCQVGLCILIDKIRGCGARIF